MMRPSLTNWPPLIVVSNKPRWVWWRDLGLTVFMWAVFAFMLEAEFELFFGEYLERLGWGDFDTEPDWEQFLRRLRPYIGLIIMQVTALGIAAVSTIHRFRVAFRRPLPHPLQPAEEARRGRMDVAALLAARELRDAVVYVEPDGTHRVEPRSNGRPRAS